MGTIRFTLYSSKTTEADKQILEIIYQVQGQRKRLSLKEKLWPANWDQGIQRAKYLDKKAAKIALPGIPADQYATKEEIDDINRSLEKIRGQIKDIEKRFELDGVPYSSQMVIEKLREIRTPATKKEESSDLVFVFIDKYIEENKSIREPGSLVVYKSLKNHLQNFQKEKGIQAAFSNIDAAFFRQFKTYLSTRAQNKGRFGGEVTGLNNTTVAKQLSTLKTFLNYARQEGKAVSERYREFKITKPKLEVIALTPEEFERLFHLDLSKNERLARVRDIFCFSCVTGLRYSDLAQLRREHIKDDEIRLTIKKTKVELSVPLTPYSVSILDRYSKHHLPLPIISNQKLNKYVKELCKAAGINDPVEIVREFGNKRISKVYPKYELIGVHTGRKSFVTISLAKGMRAEEVMKISGHENYESFKRYVNITDQRKKQAMQAAWGTPDPSSAKLNPRLKIV